MNIYKGQPKTNNKKCVYYFLALHIDILFSKWYSFIQKIWISEVTHEMHAGSVYDFTFLNKECQTTER